MLLKDWKSLKQGDIIFNNNVGVYAVVNLPPQNNKISIVENSGDKYPILTIKEVTISDDTHLKYRVLKNRTYTKGEYGMYTSSHPFRVISDDNEETIKVKNKENKIIIIPRLNFVPRPLSILDFGCRFKVKSHILKNRRVEQDVHRRDITYSPLNKIVSIYDTRNISNEFKELTSDYTNASNSDKIQALLVGNSSENMSMHFPSELEPYWPTESKFQVNNTVIYIGKDFLNLKCGDKCMIKKIKVDYASHHLNIVEIVNVKNKYTTRVFEKDLKKVI